MGKKPRTRKIQRQAVFDPKLRRKVKFDGQRRARVVSGGGAVPKRIRKERQAQRAVVAAAGGDVGAAGGVAVDGAGRPKPKKKKLKAWQRASRREEEPEEGRGPTPRGDLAHYLSLARLNGVAVKSKAEMPALAADTSSKAMAKKLLRRVQPRYNAYNGQGLARASVYLELRQPDFSGQFRGLFAEHVSEWGGRHLKSFKSEKDLNMEWRQRLKAKQASDPGVFVSKKDRAAQRRASGSTHGGGAMMATQLRPAAGGGGGGVGAPPAAARAGGPPSLGRQVARRPQRGRGGAVARHPDAQALASAYRQLKQRRKAQPIAK